MHRRGGDTQGSLRYHTRLFRPFDTRNDITGVVKTTEDTGNIHTLRLLHLIHQLTDIVRNGIHSDGVKTTVEHMGLDSCLVERLTECTDGGIRILTRQQVDLLKGTSIGFHTGKASHINNHRGNTLQLILTGLELTT